MTIEIWKDATGYRITFEDQGDVDLANGEMDALIYCLDEMKGEPEGTYKAVDLGDEEDA